MKLGIFLYVVGCVLAVAYLLTMCYTMLGEMLYFKHPRESTVTRVFIKIASVYAVVVFVYLIGHYAGGRV